MSALTSEKGLVFPRSSRGTSSFDKIRSILLFLRNSQSRQRFHRNCHCRFSLDWQLPFLTSQPIAQQYSHLFGLLLLHFCAFCCFCFCCCCCCCCWKKKGFRFDFLRSFPIMWWKVPRTAKKNPFKAPDYLLNTSLSNADQCTAQFRHELFDFISQCHNHAH